MAKTIKGAKRVTHLYNRIKSLKTVSHYQLQENHPKPVVLTELIKIAEDKQYYQISGFLYRLHLRGHSTWSKASANLKPVAKEDLICIGKMKIKGETGLLITLFNQDYSQIIIDVFPGFYPADKEELADVLGDHSYFYR